MVPQVPLVPVVPQVSLVPMVPQVPVVSLVPQVPVVPLVPQVPLVPVVPQVNYLHWYKCILIDLSPGSHGVLEFCSLPPNKSVVQHRVIE